MATNAPDAPKVERKIISFGVSPEWQKQIAHAATDAGSGSAPNYVRQVLAQTMGWDLAREPSPDTRLTAKTQAKLAMVDAMRSAGFGELADQLADILSLKGAKK